jgi:hypothetical protein
LLYNFCAHVYHRRMRKLILVLSVILGISVLLQSGAFAQTPSLTGEDQCEKSGRCEKGAAFPSDVQLAKPECKAAVKTRAQVAKNVAAAQKALASAGTQYDQQKAGAELSVVAAQLDQTKIHVTKACYEYDK